MVRSWLASSCPSSATSSRGVGAPVRARQATFAKISRPKTTLARPDPTPVPPARVRPQRQIRVVRRSTRCGSLSLRFMRSSCHMTDRGCSLPGVLPGPCSTRSIKRRTPTRRSVRKPASRRRHRAAQIIRSVGAALGPLGGRLMNAATHWYRLPGLCCVGRSSPAPGDCRGGHFEVCVVITARTRQHPTGRLMQRRRAVNAHVERRMRVRG